MLTTITDHKQGTISFVCPFCNNIDAAHLSMPKVCWYCKKGFLFDVEKLIERQYYRYTYYMYEVT